MASPTNPAVSAVVSVPGGSDMNLKQYMLTSENLLQAFWISINELRFTFFIASLNIWLNDITHGDSEQGITRFHFTCMCGCG